jgi:hypothetical protein
MGGSVRAVSVAIIAALVIVLSAPAEANPERVFRGQILTAAKSFPTAAKSKRAYVRKLKKLRKSKFLENKKKKSWKIYYAAFFRRPLNDLEITVKLYDITDGRKKLVNSYEQYLSERGQRSLISYIEIERQYFGVNKRILMTMESRNYILAMGRFYILGEGERYSGEVDFTDDAKK